MLNWFKNISIRVWKKIPKIWPFVIIFSVLGMTLFTVEIGIIILFILSLCFIIFGWLKQIWLWFKN